MPVQKGAYETTRSITHINKGIQYSTAEIKQMVV